MIQDGCCLPKIFASKTVGEDKNWETRDKMSDDEYNCGKGFIGLSAGMCSTRGEQKIKPDFKGIVKWEIFFSLKVGQLYLEERAKRKFGLKPF